ncbi:Maf-like protein [Antarcticirhabdus aurantiaca]|uniref:Maf-like protein n=1 Tax=Antarcticirhabdus aurantiaca TaxID=2606717 RepID=A0ACD4NPJ7_9HYPH|nr:Maf-like protein [Antarcticirhabdus aurantiaca]WAJ28652.1 Maf-like protein [Jeongeuplla avenae]
MTRPILLASASVHRARMLEAAGIAFEVRASSLDERAMEAPLKETGVSPDDLAAILAEAKAVSVSEGAPGAVVVGADQTLSFKGEVLHKPDTMEAARRQLLRLSGETHRLHSAAVIAEDGVSVWRHVETVSITFRQLDPAFVGEYLASVGEAALTSVGAYQIEGRGIQLVERIDGDFFSIVGLPLLPLLAALRERGAIDG